MNRRLQLGLSRKSLAARAGISQWTLKLFESTGKVSLETLLKISIALDASTDFTRLFAADHVVPRTLEELEGQHPTPRRRGRTVP